MDYIIITQRCKEIRREAWDSMRGNWGKSVLATLIFVMIALIPTGILTYMGSGFIGNIYSFIVTGPLILGFTIFFLRLYRKEEANITDIFIGFERFGRSLLLYFMINLFVFLWTLPAVIAMIIFAAAGIFTMPSVGSPTSFPSGGIFFIGIILCILLLIPAIIAQLRYSQSFIILADHPEMRAMDALNESKRLMKGNVGKLFLLGLSFIGWFLLSILTLGILMLWIMPYLYMAYVVFYSILTGKDRFEDEIEEDNESFEIKSESAKDDVNKNNDIDTER